MNEELQATNEELQSLNESLSTNHLDLQNYIDHLFGAKIEVENLLNHIDEPTLFLDRNLCIKHFTPKTTEIINLILADVGRPVNHLVFNIHYQYLTDDAQTVLKTQEPMETGCLDKQGDCYLIRIKPYRTTNNIVDGLVITFVKYPSPNGYAALVGASCDLRRELSTPFAVALALTSIATEELFTQSPCPGESAKLMRRIFFAALMSLSWTVKHDGHAHSRTDNGNDLL